MTWKRNGRRIKVACINWSHADAPHALAYVLDPAEGIVAERYFDTWPEAIAYTSEWQDPTHGRIDRDIQEHVDRLIEPSESNAVRAAMENTLQAKRDRQVTP